MYIDLKKPRPGFFLKNLPGLHLARFFPTLVCTLYTLITQHSRSQKVCETAMAEKNTSKGYLLVQMDGKVLGSVLLLNTTFKKYYILCLA